MSRGMESNLTQESQEGRSRHQGRMLRTLRAPRSRCNGMFASSSHDLFHNVTNRSPVPAKIIKSIQMAAPEQRSGCLCRSPGFLPLCSFPFIHWPSPRTTHHSASDCGSEAAHQGLNGALSPQGLPGQTVVLRANDKGYREWQ